MISYLSALEKIFSTLPARQKQNRKLSESNGYFLAEDIVSPMNLPSFDNSAMDGYALRSIDTAGAVAESPISLRIEGESVAGRQFKGTVGRGECVYITTGAIVPDGADAIIPVEEIEKISEGEIGITSDVKKNNHVGVLLYAGLVNSHLFSEKRWLKLLQVNDLRQGSNFFERK